MKGEIYPKRFRKPSDRRNKDAMLYIQNGIKMFMNSKKRGYLFFITGVCLYSFSDAIMKYFMPLYGVHQVTFFRTIFRFIPFLLLALFRGINPLRTKRIKENVFRSALASCGTYSFMCAYNYSPMIDVLVVGLTTAIFVIPLSVWILKEKFYMQNAIAVFWGFGGICLALRPGKGIFQLGIMFAVAGAIIAALNQVIVKKLTSTESELTIIFYHHLFLIILSFFAGWSTLISMTIGHTMVLFAGGLFGAFAQYFIVHSFKLSTSSELASAGYVMLIPNTIFDFFLYDKIPDMYIIAGLGLILLGTFRTFIKQSKL
ncbi:MAG: DMT family transporter [Holosporaceae bacterium]|jgi:drug/metabolite transporter (DMT)-like permease|nr:DMT family transporter [Holosporaceae bacterium]